MLSAECGSPSNQLDEAPPNRETFDKLPQAPNNPDTFQITTTQRTAFFTKHPMTTLSATSSALSPSGVQTPSAYPKDQISPPPSTTFMSPTIGMEGWLTLDDLREKEEKANKEIETLFSQNPFIMNHRILPGEPTLSPIEDYLSAMPSPLPLVSSDTSSTFHPSSSIPESSKSSNSSVSAPPEYSVSTSQFTTSDEDVVTASFDNQDTTTSSQVYLSSPSSTSLSTPESSKLSNNSISATSESSTSLSQSTTSDEDVVTTSSFDDQDTTTSSPFYFSTPTPSSTFLFQTDEPLMSLASASIVKSTSVSDSSSTSLSPITLQSDPSSSLSQNSLAPVLSSHSKRSADRAISAEHTHRGLFRRAAVGFAVLNSLALTAAMPLEEEETSPSKALSEGHSRALSTNVFGFEAVLTGLVYLSFGIFLYQMIQRAVDAKVLGMPFAPAGTRNRREMNLDEHPIDLYFTVLQQALQKVPNSVSEITLEGLKAWQMKRENPECLPLYLCRLNQFYHHRELSTNSSTVSSDSHENNIVSNEPQAIFTSALSSIMELWSGQDHGGDLLMATWTGALGLPCDQEEIRCSNSKAGNIKPAFASEISV